MKDFQDAGELADALLREHGQNNEYPYLTTDRWRRISAHEVVVSDIEAVNELLLAEERLDRLRVRERAASALRRMA